MSEINNSNLPETKVNGKKEITNGVKIAMGAILGVLTAAGITLSGAINEIKMFRLIDPNLKLVLQYLWVGFFLVYIFWFRGIETNREISMKSGRMAYLIVIALYLVVILTLNLTGHKISFNF